jgi:hypothetical protein
MYSLFDILYVSAMLLTYWETYETYSYDYEEAVFEVKAKN